MEESGYSLIYAHTIPIFVWRDNENLENCSQYGRFLGRYLNPGFPNMKLPSRPPVRLGISVAVFGTKPRVPLTPLACEQKENAHTIQTKYISDKGSGTANYKALALGNNVYSKDSTCFLTCYPSHPSERHAFYFQRVSNSRIRPDYCSCNR
jgi:hypothetical protein